jgi:FkbM family methyltransferase
MEARLKQRLRAILRSLGYEIKGIKYTPQQLLDLTLARRIEFDDIVCRYMFERGEALSFIEVGACDGETNDPLRKYITRCGWRGMLIEPQPAAAARLRTLYKDNDRVTIHQIAIDRKRGNRTLYAVDSSVLDIPQWAAGLASFDRSIVAKHEDQIPGLSTAIIEISVPCTTFDDILAGLPDEQVDFLQIDAEGADRLLLSMFPFHRLKPSIIHWETKHDTKQQKEETLSLLAGHGYRFAAGDEDTTAILTTPNL